jgi:hypothetical protein
MTRRMHLERDGDITVVTTDIPRSTQARPRSGAGCWEGGLVFWSRDRGEAALRADLDWLAEVSGPGFVRGDLRHVLG